jgi:ABC-type amino acid transport system permease subunit
MLFVVIRNAPDLLLKDCQNSIRLMVRFKLWQYACRAQTGINPSVSSRPSHQTEAGAGQNRVIDDGVWMRVHAFNCLRVTFESSALAADTSAFFAEALKLCVLAMSADHWEVCYAIGLDSWKA